VASLPLDLQLRENDTAQLYCGLTALLVARPTTNGFQISTHSTYSQQPCAEPLIRCWQQDEPGFANALAQYLSVVQVNERHTCREGLVQAEWMSIQAPWIPIDREGVLGYSTIEERAAALDCAAVQQGWQAARDLFARKKWAALKPLGDSNEIDQIAIGPEGELVFVELKHGGADDVYQAPVQALRYIWEWYAALEAILPGLKAVVDARRKLGLSPESTPNPVPRMRWALAVGRETPSAEVRRRLDLTCELVNEYRPPEIPPLELWRMDEHGSPSKL
jgi:hypothetical protein